jgi:hypothetical protein
MMSTELHIYDFDGTLFRSPHQPAVWEGDWWSDPASLLPPCVPEKPGSEWWIASTVSSAKRSISDSDVYAVMMTGRKDDSAFRYRVPELMKQKGLNFDAVHLSRGSDSLAGKVRTILKYLSRYPFIDTVRIWDDRGSHLRKFQQVLERMGYEVHTELVRARSLDPLCGEGEGEYTVDVGGKRPSYIGVFLDARSKAALQDAYGFDHDKVKNEHVTLGFKLTPELEALIGQPVTMRVVGHASDDLGQAVVVDLPSDVPFTKKGLPHVTLSHDGSVEAKYSNDLLASGYKRVRGPTISGVLDTYPRRLRRVASAVRVASLYRHR